MVAKPVVNVASDAASGRKYLDAVPLRQVAAVHAALAEGFALEHVLKIEQLDEGMWQQAELFYKPLIVRDKDGYWGRYGMALAEQQDRLRGKVMPLENDVEGWISFLHHYGCSEDKSAFLAQVGLNNNHLARLQRRWSKLFEHPEVVREVEKTKRRLDKRAAGKGLELPPLRVEASTLLPSDAAGQAAKNLAEAESKATARVAGEQLLRSFPLDVYAALQAELSCWSSRRDSHLQRYQLDEAKLKILQVAWASRLDKDGQLKRDHDALLRHYQQRADLRQDAHASGAGEVEGDEVEVGAMGASGSLDETAALVALDLGAVEQSGLLGNAFLYDEALPFQPPKSAAELGIFPVAHLLAEHEDKGETEFAFAALGDAELFPFRAVEKPVEASTEDVVGGGREPAKEGPLELDETSMVAAFDFDASVWPFASAPSSDNGVATGNPPPGVPDSGHLPSAMAARSGEATAYQFGLEHYASLCAELRFRPEAYWQTLGRYGIHDQAAWDALRQHFEERFRRSMAESERFAQLQLQYDAFLRSALPPSHG